MKKTIAIVSGLILIVLACLYVMSLNNESEQKTSDKGSTSKDVVAISLNSGPRTTMSPLTFFNPQGGIISYRFQSHSEADFRMVLLMPAGSQDDGKLNHVRVNASGEMAIAFFPKNAREWTAVAKITWQDYRINEQRPSFYEDMDSIFSYTFAKEGRISDFTFKKGIDESAQGAIRQLLQSMQVVLPQNSRDHEWTTRESDNEGTFTARYALDENSAKDNLISILKYKEQYFVREQKAQSKGVNNDFKTEVENSLARITLLPSSPWINSISLNESIVTTTSRGERCAKSSLVFSANRTTTTSLILPKSLTELQKYLGAEDLLISKYYQTDPEMNRLARGLDLGGAIDLFAKLWQTQDENQRELAERFIINYLRLYPKQSYEYVDFLDKNRPVWLDENVELRLWHYLTKVGHLESQLAVSGVLNSPGYSELSRYRALAYLHDFEYPQQQTTQQITRFIDSMNGMSGVKVEDLRAMAYYALGSSGSVNKLNENIQPEVRNILFTKLHQASSDVEEASILLAIGNTGQGNMLPVIEPYLSAQNDMVRSSAYDALRRMDSDNAIELLLDNLHNENNEGVRITAIKTINVMPNKSSALVWARSQLSQPVSNDEKIELIRLLGDTMKDNSENEVVLRELLSTNPPREIKKNVYKYISPQ